MVSNNGKKVILEDDNYTIAYVDHNGNRQTAAGTSDLQLSEQIAAKIEYEIMQRKRGLIDDWQEELVRNEQEDLAIHLEAFEAHLESKGSTERHVAKTMSYIRGIVGECSFKTGASIDGWEGVRLSGEASTKW